MKYFEDLVLGETVRSRPYPVTREDAVAFAQAFDPQPFHLSDEGTQGTPFKGLALSGWHVGAISMRLLVETVLSGLDSRGGLGVDELRWRNPTYPGDTLTFETTIVEKRVSRSQPGCGIVRYQSRVFNQDGQTVMTYCSAGLVGRREGEAS